MTETAAVDFWQKAIAVPEPLPCWEWNCRYGRLSSRDSAMPGPWLGSVVPYLRHFHELVTARKRGKSYMGARDPWAHLCEQIWLVMGTQSAKTRSLLYAAMGYLIDQHPSPKALILPRTKDFKRVLDNRIRPFFRETPQLARHFPEGKQAEKIAITYQAWTLNPCTLFMLCGELADDLRSWPVCDLLFDEFALLPDDCEGQGDPIELALDRQKTWPRRRLAIGASTPTKIDNHAWRRLCSGSHERLFVRCPACKGDQELHPDQLVYPEETSPDIIKVDALARWECKHCKHPIDTETKDRLVSEAATADRWIPGKWAVSADFPAGKWTPHCEFDAKNRATWNPPQTTVRTGHMNSLYSPFISLSEFASHELAAKERGNGAEWVAHLNGWRCEPLIPLGISSISTDQIVARVGAPYGRGAAPLGALKLALIFDQQGNSKDTSWFPFVARAWGPLGDSWMVDCGQVHGWDELESLCLRTWVVGNRQAHADVLAMDSANGNVRVAVQEWASREPDRRILMRGYQLMDVPFRRRQADSRGKRLLPGVIQYYFHSTAYKTDLNDALSGTAKGRKWRVPSDVPDFYLKSMTSEERILEHRRVPNQGWVDLYVWQPRAMYDERGKVTIRSDNHHWDCETMALAVGDIMEWNALAAPIDEPIRDRGRGQDRWDSALEPTE